MNKTYEVYVSVDKNGDCTSRVYRNDDEHLHSTERATIDTCLREAREVIENDVNVRKPTGEQRDVIVRFAVPRKNVKTIEAINAVRDADIAIDHDGRLIKNRYGPTGVKATPEQVAAAAVVIR